MQRKSKSEKTDKAFEGKNRLDVGKADVVINIKTDQYTNEKCIFMHYQNQPDSKEFMSQGVTIPFSVISQITSSLLKLEKTL